MHNLVSMLKAVFLQSFFEDVFFKIYMLNNKKIRRRVVGDIDPSLHDLPEKIQQILTARGISQRADLDYSLSNLLPADELKDVHKAACVLFSAIKQQQSILIIGDYDADGATSSALLIKALKAMGAIKVNFLVPDRFKLGYGLSVELVKQAAKLNPDLIITVDNGISSYQGVAQANQLAIPVIITDHHLAGEKLPDALAIVNPNQPGDNFSSKNLAGVGVAFYLMLALRSLMRDENWFAQQNIPQPNLAVFLDLVALGTVADLVPLDKNNRILVEQGLKRMRSGFVCQGITALFQVANRDICQASATDLAFAIAPRLNAAGRLDDMAIGIDCLLAEDLNTALAIATQLDNFNHSRKQIEQQMFATANKNLEEYMAQQSQQLNQQQAEPLPALCAYNAHWHQGVIGILASRLKEKINRPVIVFTVDDENQTDNKNLKGSARSVKGVHIRDVLARIKTQHPDLIEKFGGHAMAAGLTIKQENYQRFADCYVALVAEQIEAVKDEIVSDGELSAAELNLGFANHLRNLGPWGQGFPEPLFDDEFMVVNSRCLAQAHLKLLVEKQGVVIDAIYFRCPKLLLEQPLQKVKLVYQLTINHFNGKQTPQLMIQQLEIL